MARFNAFAACCFCLALMSGAMAARDLRGYGTTYTPPQYTPSPVSTYQPSPYTPTGVSYPICTLSPPPFEVNNLDKPAGGRYGDFTACFDLSAKGYNGYDLAALQLVVADKCYDEVKSVSFGGQKYEPELTRYTNEKSVGVKIGGKSLVTFKSLYTPVKVCITLKGACANADSLYNIITYFPVYSANCATTTLYNPTPSPYSYSYSPSPVTNSYPSPVYTPSPMYESPSPVYEQHSPVYESPSPVYYKSPSPVYQSPSPMYESPSPVYESPSPVYYKSPSPVYYKSPSPVYYKSPSPVYESPSPVYESPSPVYYESPSPVYYKSPSPVYQSPSPVYESPSPVYTPVYKSPSPAYKY